MAFFSRTNLILVLANLVVLTIVVSSSPIHPIPAAAFPRDVESHEPIVEVTKEVSHVQFEVNHGHPVVEAFREPIISEDAEKEWFIDPKEKIRGHMERISTDINSQVDTIRGKIEEAIEKMPVPEALLEDKSDSYVDEPMGETGVTDQSDPKETTDVEQFDMKSFEKVFEKAVHEVHESMRKKAIHIPDLKNLQQNQKNFMIKDDPTAYEEVSDIKKEENILESEIKPDLHHIQSPKERHSTHRNARVFIEDYDRVVPDNEKEIEKSDSLADREDIIPDDVNVHETSEDSSPVDPNEELPYVEPEEQVIVDEPLIEPLVEENDEIYNEAPSEGTGINDPVLTDYNDEIYVEETSDNLENHDNEADALVEVVNKGIDNTQENHENLPEEVIEPINEPVNNENDLLENTDELVSLDSDEPEMTSDHHAELDIQDTIYADNSDPIVIPKDHIIPDLEDSEEMDISESDLPIVPRHVLPAEETHIEDYASADDEDVQESNTAIPLPNASTIAAHPIVSSHHDADHLRMMPGSAQPVAAPAPRDQLGAFTITAIVFAALCSIVIMLAVPGYVYYQRRHLNRPKELKSDRSCANSESGGYIDDQCRVSYVNSTLDINKKKEESKKPTLIGLNDLKKSGLSVVPNVEFNVPKIDLPKINLPNIKAFGEK